MFIKEVTEELNKIGCRYFAVAPEVNPKDYQQMNTGVMLMNLENLMFRWIGASGILSLQIWRNFLAGTNRHINGFINGREKGFSFKTWMGSAADRI